VCRIIQIAKPWRIMRHSELKVANGKLLIWILKENAPLLDLEWSGNKLAKLNILVEWQTSHGASGVWRVQGWQLACFSLVLGAVLATGPNCQFGSGSSSTQIWTVAMGLTTRKTCTIGNGPVLPPKTRHFKFTILAPTKWLSSDRITTRSICRLCSFSLFFPCRFQICDLTSIRWVAIENQPISLTICHFITTTQQISVRLHIWIQDVKERQKLNNLRIDHVMIRSKLKYLIGAQAAGTVYLEP